MQDSLKKQTAAFQQDVKNPQKNGATMSKSDAAKAQQKIQAEQSALMSAQSKCVNKRWLVSNQQCLHL